jgi:hypothetical protein
MAWHTSLLANLRRLRGTAEGRWVKALSHPASDHIRNVNDINGRMENPRFRKDLNDPKTNRPCRRGIEVDIRFFKDRTVKDVLDKIWTSQLKDNSIGFSCDKDVTPGEFQGQKSLRKGSKNMKINQKSQLTSPGGTPLLFDHSGAGGGI